MAALPSLSTFDSPAVRFAVRVVRGFVAHRGMIRASSLAYTTLLSLVPLLAVVLSISKGILRNQDPEAFRSQIDNFLSYAIPQLQYLSQDAEAQARQDVLTRIAESIERINAGALGAFGALTLVSVGILLLSSIESALNDVWGLEEGRPFVRRVAYYWAAVSLAPVLLFFSIGLTSSAIVANVLGVLPGPMVTIFLQLVLPVALLGIGFTLLYWTMPNTTVPLRAAAWGGATAGLLFQCNNMASALYFSQVVYYSNVYGSVGAVPVLMIGIYFAWMIVLIGAEVAYAVAMPARTADPYPEAYEARSRIALEVARVTAERFLAGRGGSSVAEIAERLQMPSDWVHRTLQLLCRHAMVILAAPSPEADEDPRYLPARPPSNITVLDVLRVMRADGEGGDVRSSEPIVEVLRKLETAEHSVLAPVTLKELARSSRKDAE